MQNNKSSSIESADFAGWLYKQGSLIKSWKRRFMVLRGCRVTYYDTSVITAKTKEKGVVVVEAVQINHDMNNAMILSTAGNREMKVYADSEANCTMWFQKFQKVLAQSQTVRETLPTTLAQFHANGRALTTNPEYAKKNPKNNQKNVEMLSQSHCGWLEKEGSRVKSWKRRYFSLRGRYLSYFKTADIGGKALGKGFVVCVVVKASKPFTLDIRFQKKLRVLSVTADTQEEMERWFTAIFTAIHGKNVPQNVNANDRKTLEDIIQHNSSGDFALHDSNYDRPHSRRTSLLDSQVLENNSYNGDIFDSSNSMVDSRTVPDIYEGTLPRRQSRSLLDNNDKTRSTVNNKNPNELEETSRSFNWMEDSYVGLSNSNDKSRKTDTSKFNGVPNNLAKRGSSLNWIEDSYAGFNRLDDKQYCSDISSYDSSTSSLSYDSEDDFSKYLSDGSEKDYGHSLDDRGVALAMKEVAL